MTFLCQTIFDPLVNQLAAYLERSVFMVFCLVFFSMDNGGRNSILFENQKNPNPNQDSEFTHVIKKKNQAKSGERT
jgi:hypothetical protein